MSIYFKDDPSSITYASAQLKEVYVNSRIDDCRLLKDRCGRDVAGVSTESFRLWVKKLEKMLGRAVVQQVATGVVGGKILMTLETKDDINNFCYMLSPSLDEVSEVGGGPVRPETEVLAFGLGIFAQAVIEKCAQGHAVSDYEKSVSRQCFKLLLERKSFCEGAKFCQIRLGSLVVQKKKRGRTSKQGSSIYLVRQRHDELSEKISTQASEITQATKSSDTL